MGPNGLRYPYNAVSDPTPSRRLNLVSPSSPVANLLAMGVLPSGFRVGVHVPRSVRAGERGNSSVTPCTRPTYNLIGL